VLVLGFRFFFVVGPVLAAWAVVLGVLGIMRPGFPGRIGGQRIVIAITAALMLTTVLSAMIGAKFEHTEQVKSGPAAHGKRGSPQP
jgi:hypothetical protein